MNIDFKNIDKKTIWNIIGISVGIVLMLIIAWYIIKVAPNPRVRVDDLFNSRTLSA